jgi:MYXO-CTERM domain-containing protein
MANGECRTGICAGTCTRLCDGGESCPEGYLCSPAGEHMGCFPAPAPVSRDSGCTASPASGAGRGILALLVLVALSIGRRRRR